MKQGYEGKVALVTGGGSGIGAALAEALHAAGAVVVVADINEAAARAVAARLGPRHRGVGLDVRNAVAVEMLIDEMAEREGRIDFVFNNAGVAVVGEFHRLSRADLDRVLDVNLRGAAYVAHAAFRRMAVQGFGHLVNTASGYGLVPSGANAPYATTKFGVVGLSESLRLEGHDLGVRVSVVCPGFVRTPIVDKMHAVGLDAEKVRASVPFAPVEAAEAARIVLDGVARNRAIIAFPRYVGLMAMFYRLFPKVAFRFGLRMVRRMRRHRTDDAAPVARRGPTVPWG